ncbi:hypothetical protein [Polyangium sp. 15x6]|uniref:hypothetical protein n=1 Tax=Polyangium sp. 15x6 TaxID=3042687 RepID=UPI00249AD932|nr:hypothetical protein [Polyangium sp. 15x6]MDI3291510.1 hypothetical protein [Polyangium sp. 15x6]
MSGWTKRGTLVVATMGALSTIGMASCALTDYQPPTANTTSSTGGAGGTGGTGGMPGPGGPGGTGGMPGPGGPGGGGGEACAEGSQCLPGVPFKDGWTGPYWGRPTAWNENAGACPDGKSPLILYADPSPAECKPCECKLPAGTVCSGAALSCWAGDSCGSGGDEPKTFDSGCIPNTSMPGQILGLGTSSCQVTGTEEVILPTGSACTATGSGLKNANLWESNVHLCSIEQASSCPDGGACVTVPPGTYGDYACITKPGENECPAGWESMAKLSYGKFTEGRMCPDCACLQKQLSCDLKGAFSKSGSACGAVGTDIETCTTFGLGSGARIQHPAPMIPEAACPQPVGTGSVSAQEPTTICCHQLF